MQDPLQAPFHPALPSPAEMQRYDELTIRERGISGETLMERAGRAVFEELASSLRKASHITILCGPGNNGGDGLVIGRHCLKEGMPVEIFIAPAERYSEDFLHQLRKLQEVAAAKNQKLPAFVSFYWTEESVELPPEIRSLALPVRKDLPPCNRETIIIDALLGTGSSGELRGVIRELVLACGGYRVCAVDAPTGVNSDTGAVGDPHIEAEKTVSIEFLKRGLLQYPARGACGELVAVSIGIEESSPSEYHLLDCRALHPLPLRDPNGHKGTFGRVLVIGGSRSMPGAPYLTALAALRSGAGSVTVAHGAPHAPSPMLPEVMYLQTISTGGHLTEKDIETITAVLSEYDTVVIGPGLGLHQETIDFLEGLFPHLAEKPLVIDADALTFLAHHTESPFPIPKAVLTPHPGEAARLLHRDTATVQRNRYEAAAHLTEQYQATVILKGAGTLVRSPTAGWASPVANPGLATAGSGDVLAGIIAALFPGNANDINEVAKWAVLVHQQAGALAQHHRGSRIIASDIVEEISQAIDELTDAVSTVHK
ncbi:NAD(P)H-hydrate dehydratase [bacterium]|nr:NAD(P)H-hydrate dehydratase [bacterium]